MIQGVCATGWAVPSYVVVKGKYHLLPWYQNGQFPKDWRIHTSENGWTTNEIGLDWIKHFNQHTKARTKGVYRLLVLDGHESYHSSNFEDYCQENNIITLCMPPHSSHFLQPLDVWCFGPLKTSYGKQIEKMMRMQITHISRSGTPNSWVTKTPQTAYEVNQQSTTIKNKIAKHQDSSPTHIYTVIDAQARGMSKMAHELVLLQAELKDVRAANEVLSKRRRAKKARLRQGGSLSFQEAEDLVAENEVDKQIKEETHRGQCGE